ncbi:hypothetical protein BGW41_005049 [Actinomortierella wolfii]|nr:hypothetical protein BGW41_005049 [Actinomortierella wolfii]
MSFFGSTQGQGGSSPGSGGSSNSNAASSWGSFLKQGLSQIESKLDKVLDMQVPIPSGGALSAFSPHSMSTLLASPETTQGNAGVAQNKTAGGGGGSTRQSADVRRSNIEESTRPSSEKSMMAQQQDGGSTSVEEDSAKRSASPKPTIGQHTGGAARSSQDLRKSATIGLRQTTTTTTTTTAAATQQGGSGNSPRTSTTSRNSESGEPSMATSVEVDPVTGMVTAAPTPRVMNASSPSISPASSTATSPAPSAAAASRERLENRMRGIFKKPAASSSTSVRSSSEVPSPSLPPSIPLSTSTTPSRTQSPTPVSAPQKESQSPMDPSEQPTTSKAETQESVEGENKQVVDNSENTTTVAKEESPEEEKKDELTSEESVDKDELETSSKQTVKTVDEDCIPEAPSSPTAAAPAPSQADQSESTKTEVDDDAAKLSKDASEKSEKDEENVQAVPEASKVEKQTPIDDKLPQAEKENECAEASVVDQAEEVSNKDKDVQSGASANLDIAPEQESAIQNDAKGVEDHVTPSPAEDNSLSSETVAPVSETSVEPPLGDSTSENEISPSKETEGSTVPREDGVSTPPSAEATTASESVSKHPAEAHLTKVIEQREQQLFKVMQEHSQLLERHRDLEEAKAAEQELLNNKVAGLESIIEQQKKELDMARSSAAAAAGTPKSVQRTLDEQKKLLEEKDEQIRGLLAEGEVLSKKEFKHLTTIKTLRAKNIEMEKSQQDLQQKLNKAQASNTETQAKLNRLTEEQRQLSETVRSLTDQNNRQNKQISKLESELNQMREDKANLQLSLDRAWHELEDARKASDAMSAQAQQAAVEQERKANEELQAELSSIQQEHATLVAQLRQEIQDLRVSLSNRDEAAGELEDQLRAEIRGLQWRLEQTDGDALEMQEAIEEARRPLQRQLESLQAQHHASIRNWERIEKQLTSRVHDAEEDLLKAQNREKAAKERLDAMKTQMAGFEARLDTLRSADTQLRTELSAAKRQCLEKEEALKAAQGELAKERLLRDRAIEEAKEDESRRIKLIQQEEMEKLKATIKQLQQQLAVKEEQQQQQQQQHHHPWVQDRLQRRESSSSLNTTNGGVQGYGPERTSFDSTTGSIDGASMSRSNSVLGMLAGSKGVPSSPPPLGSPSLMGLSGASGSSGPAVAIERLSSLVRQLEGQVAFLNEQVRTSNKNKDELSEELVKVSMELESLQGAATRAPALEQELKQLQERHTAALELLGEKTEEVQELKADLADVKEAYRDQLNELLGQLEGYRKSATMNFIHNLSQQSKKLVRKLSFSKHDDSPVLSDDVEDGPPPPSFEECVDVDIPPPPYTKYPRSNIKSSHSEDPIDAVLEYCRMSEQDIGLERDERNRSMTPAEVINRLMRRGMLEGGGGSNSSSSNNSSALFNWML